MKFLRSSPRIVHRSSALMTLALLALGVAPHRTAFSDEIVLVSPDYWCPFSCKSDAPQEGFTVDIIRAIFSAAGHRVRLINENYSRALIDVRAGVHTATPSTLKEEAPDFVFPELPVSRNRYCFYVAPSSPWQYRGEASLQQRKTGIIRDYAYGNELDPFIKAHPERFDVHTGDNLTERLIRRVEAGRIDGFIEEENLVSYTLKKQPKLSIKNAGCIATNYAFMAISPAHPKAREYAELFSAGMRQLKKTGQLKTILARYGVAEWPLPVAR